MVAIERAKVAPGTRFTKRRMTKLCSRASAIWKRLTPDIRSAYDYRAEGSSTARQQSLQGDVELLESTIGLARMRATEEQAAGARRGFKINRSLEINKRPSKQTRGWPQNKQGDGLNINRFCLFRGHRFLLKPHCAGAALRRVASVRFEQRDLDSIAALWSMPTFTQSMVHKHVRSSLRQPAVVTGPLAEFMAANEPTDSPPQRSKEIATWLGKVCWGRRSLQEAVFHFQRPGESEITALFSYATQSPLQVSFMRLWCPQRRRPSPLALEAGSWEDAALQCYEVEYSAEPLRVVTEKDLQAFSIEHVSICPITTRGPGGTVRCLGDTHCLAEVLAAIPETERSSSTEKKPRSAKKKARLDAVDDHLKAKHPGMEKAIHAPPGKGHSDSSSSSEEEMVDEAEVEFCPTDQAKAWMELAAKRAQVLAEERPVREDFVLKIRGGAGTQRRKGVAFDTARGEAKGSTVKTWCHTYGLVQSRSYAYQKWAKTNEQAPEELCRIWCARMQAFYDMYLVSNRRRFTYSSAQIDSVVTPASLREAALEGEAGHGRDMIAAAIAEIEAIVPVNPRQ